jgi:hypothetical protein
MITIFALAPMLLLANSNVVDSFLMAEFEVRYKDVQCAYPKPFELFFVAKFKDYSLISDSIYQGTTSCDEAKIPIQFAWSFLSDGAKHVSLIELRIACAQNVTFRKTASLGRPTSPGGARIVDFGMIDFPCGNN